MAIIAPYFNKQEFDNNGNPLSSGTIESYEAGTSTNKDTFTNSVGDVANTNPIVLDANGRASIWLETGSYKFITKDSLGNIISTVDNITGGASNVFGSTVISVSTNTNVTSTFLNNFISCTATLTLSLLDGATAGEGFIFVAKNDGLGLVTIDPDGADTIDGESTIVLNPQAWSIVVSDGTNWKTLTNNEQKNNISATTAPGVGDDSADGYSIGSHWYDVTADEAYVCLDATAGAAVWVNSTLTTAELGTSATKDFIDDDTFATASAITTASSESIKAYIDGEITRTITTTTTANNHSVDIPQDSTIPQNTEGGEILTLAYTPTSATSKLVIEWYVPVTASSLDISMVAPLFVDSVADAVSVAVGSIGGAQDMQALKGYYEVISGSTTERTYKVRYGGTGAVTYYANSSSAGALYGGLLTTYIKITEIRV